MVLKLFTRLLRFITGAESQSATNAPEKIVAETPVSEAVMQIYFDKSIFLPHTFFGKSNNGKIYESVFWSTDETGVRVNGEKAETSGGQPQTVRGIWAAYGDIISAESQKQAVPVELILATIATESKGNPNALRLEPGYLTDNQTPHRVSPGIMQTLISTAREVCKDDTLDREKLFQPKYSIMAGTAYIAQQSKQTKFDPPKVGAAYNAGGVYLQAGDENRWKMRQYPIGTGKHCDRFVMWFNDAMLMFRLDGGAPTTSFSNYFGV